MSGSWNLFHRGERGKEGERGRREFCFEGGDSFFEFFFLFFFENREFLSEFVIDVQIIMIEKLLLLLLSGSIIRASRFEIQVSSSSMSSLSFDR